MEINPLIQQKNRKAIVDNAVSVSKTLLKAVALTAMFALPAFADGGFADTDKKVCGFLDNINGLLSMASIAVVTIAVIFAGYQIAFAHKRISDVSPILIGGLLIGAAGQIASMVIGKGEGADECSAMIINSVAPYLA